MKFQWKICNAIPNTNNVTPSTTQILNKYKIRHNNFRYSLIVKNLITNSLQFK